MAELSGFEVLGLLKEIGESLRGSYVNNVFRSGGSHLIRFRKTGGEDLWLVVSPKKGVWLSGKVADRTETSEFTTKLRGELERSRFLGARQVDLDRIFRLEFEGVARRDLIVELMPPGNVIVTDASGRIILAMPEVRTPVRRVARGATYAAPPSSRSSPLDVDEEMVRSIIKEEKTVGAAIGRHIAIPRKYVSECLNRLGLSDDSPSSELEGRETEVVQALGDLVREARDRPSPCICETTKGDEIFIITPRELRLKASSRSLAELCDMLFLGEALAEAAPPSEEETRRKEMEVTISRLRSESGRLREQAAMARAAAGKARSSTLEESIGILQAFGVRSHREPSSPGAASSALFDEAKRLESKAEAAMQSAIRMERKLPRTGEPSAVKKKLLPRRRLEWYERFRWFITTGGNLAIGGRDAQTNSTLISRHLERNDTVYHADLFGSPFFILKGGESQSDEEVAQVAQATVAFSSAWKTGLGSADAYWVTPEQVRAAAPSGEYLQRGSFAITGKKNFVTRNIMELAVGLDPEGKVLAGPEEAIRVRSPRYVVLRPQKEKGSDTAKRVLRELTPSDEGGRRPDLDEVLRALPTGGGKIIRRGRQPSC